MKFIIDYITLVIFLIIITTFIKHVKPFRSDGYVIIEYETSTETCNYQSWTTAFFLINNFCCPIPNPQFDSSYGKRFIRNNKIYFCEYSSAWKCTVGKDELECGIVGEINKCEIDMYQTMKDMKIVRMNYKNFLLMYGSKSNRITTTYLDGCNGIVLESIVNKNYTGYCYEHDCVPRMIPRESNDPVTMKTVCNKMPSIPVDYKGISFWILIIMNSFFVILAVCYFLWIIVRFILLKKQINRKDEEIVLIKERLVEAGIDPEIIINNQETFNINANAALKLDNNNNNEIELRIDENIHIDPPVIRDSEEQVNERLIERNNNEGEVLQNQINEIKLSSDEIQLKNHLKEISKLEKHRLYYKTQLKKVKNDLFCGFLLKNCGNECCLGLSLFFTILSLFPILDFISIYFYSMLIIGNIIAITTGFISFITFVIFCDGQPCLPIFFPKLCYDNCWSKIRIRKRSIKRKPFIEAIKDDPFWAFLSIVQFNLIIGCLIINLLQILDRIIIWTV